MCNTSCDKFWYCRQTEFSNVHRIYESICNQAIKGLKDYHIRILKTSLAYDAHSNDWGSDKPFFEVGFHISFFWYPILWGYQHGCVEYVFFQYETLCAIWYHLYNLKNVKNANGGVLILVKLQVLDCNFTEANTFHERLFTIFKLHKWYQIVKSITYVNWCKQSSLSPLGFRRATRNFSGQGRFRGIRALQ